jgi:ADP-heptose:LPS heptosyltransferase
VVALDGLGDLVLRQPLLRGLAEAGYETHVLVQEGYEGLLRFLDDRLIGIPAALGWTAPPSPSTVHALVDQLRRLEPALVVSSQFNPVRYVDWIMRSLPEAFAAGFAGGLPQEVPGARALEAQLGLAPERPFDLVVACDESTPETDKAHRLLAALTGRAPSSDAPRLMLRPSERAQAAALLRGLCLTEGRFAVCYPAGTKNVTLKAWPAERYGRIAAWLSRDRDLPTLVMGHASESVVVDSVVATARASGGTRVQGWCSGEKGLETLVGLLASAGLYIGNDTGAMHVAAAAGVPVVAVFGGGHWPRFLPVAQRGAVHTRMLPCFGCGWRDCIFFDGPCAGRVEEEAVRASVERVLDGKDGFRVDAEPLPLGASDWARAVEAFRHLSARASALKDDRDAPLQEP